MRKLKNHDWEKLAIDLGKVNEENEKRINRLESVMKTFIKKHSNIEKADDPTTLTIDYYYKFMERCKRLLAKND